MIATIAILAALALAAFLWLALRPSAAAVAEGDELVLGVGARFCSSEALFEQSIDAALAAPDAPLITGCWRAGAPLRATVLGVGARPSLVRVRLEGVGEGWVQRDALRRPKQG